MVHAALCHSKLKHCFPPNWIHDIFMISHCFSIGHTYFVTTIYSFKQCSLLTKTWIFIPRMFTTTAVPDKFNNFDALVPMGLTCWKKTRIINGRCFNICAIYMDNKHCRVNGGVWQVTYVSGLHLSHSKHSSNMETILLPY